MSVKTILFAGAVLLLPVSVASAQSSKVCAVQQYGAKGDGVDAGHSRDSEGD